LEDHAQITGWTCVAGAALSLAGRDIPGITAGKPAPPFRAQDQFAKEQTLSSLMGRNGLVLLFFRSADW